MLDRVAMTLAENRREQTERSKEKLHPLPVVPGGIVPVSVSPKQVASARDRYLRMLGARLPSRRVQRVRAAACWVAYRCSTQAVTEFASLFFLAPDGVRYAITSCDVALRAGDEVAQRDVDRLMRLSIGAPIDLKEPTESDREAGSQLQNADEIYRLRRKGGSVSSISRRLDLPEMDVARVLGVQWGLRGEI